MRAVLQVLQRFDMPGRAKARAQQNEAAKAPAQAAGAAREGRGKRTQRVVTQAEPVAIGSSSPWEFQRDLGKEQRRRESGASASLLCAISTLDHDLTLRSFAGRVGVPRPLCSSFPAG